MTKNAFGFGISASAPVAPSNFVAAVNAVGKGLDVNGVMPSQEVGNSILRMENASAEPAINRVQSLNDHVSTILSTLNFDTDPLTGKKSTSGLVFRTESAKARASAAAAMGAALAIGNQAYQSRTLQLQAESGSKVMNGLGNHGSRVTLRQEAFNNIDVRRSIAFSMGFNAAITRQTDVVMAWFPPIFINPDQVSLEISLNLLTVFNGAYHDISGEKTNFARRNVARAFADPTVLNRYETLVVPVSRPESAGVLADDAIITHTEKSFGSRKVLTAPLKYETDINLIGLSSTDELLKTGAPGHRDVLEPGAKFAAMYIKSGDDVICLKTVGLKTTVFVGAQHGDQMETLLTMRTNLAIGRNLKRWDGGDLTGPLKALVDNDLRLKLNVNTGGVINVETTNAKVNKPSVTLVALVNPTTGEEITSGQIFEDLRTAVKSFEHVGYDLVTYRTNANRRQVGDRINTRRFNYVYAVPYRDPITAERPSFKQEEQDAQDLTHLQALVRVRIENETIDQIIQTAETMEAYVDMRDTDAEATDLLGLAQFFTIPTFVKDHIDLRKMVDSEKSSERSRDIQQAIVIKLRDLVARMYTDSQFKAGTDIQSGGTLPNPQVNVLCDPIIARYIMLDGEIRTLGDFEMVLTTTLNYKVRGQIFMSFRMPGQESTNEPCIFNFGHLVMSPELVLAANMTREGSYFAETQVQPRYEFVVLNPMMAHLTIDGVQEVLSKMPGYTTLTGPLEIGGVVKMEAVTGQP